MTHHQPEDGRLEASALADIFDKAADLIEPKGAWTQGALARTKSANPIGPLERNAQCWCASGALMRVSTCARPMEAWSALANLVNQSIPAWNDHPSRTQAEVVATLRTLATTERSTLRALDQTAGDKT